MGLHPSLSGRQEDDQGSLPVGPGTQGLEAQRLEIRGHVLIS